MVPEQTYPPQTTRPPAAARQSSEQDLAQVITAYNQVTQRLERSHETLQQEVLRLRQELASTNAQLQRSKRLSALGEMAAGIAHEIRNPLAAIQLYAGMVLEDLPSQSDQDDHDPSMAPNTDSTSSGIDSARDSTWEISAAVRRLSAIVNDVLSFARQLEPAPRQLTAKSVLDRLVEAHRPAIDAAGIDLKFNSPSNFDPDCEATGPTLWADPDLLHQALLNLVRNAVDAMSARASKADPAGQSEQTAVGQNKPQLSLSAWPNDDQSTTLQIRDTGPGIDQEHVDRIFNPFFTTRNTGTGLGLAIVHRIIDAHGGSITVWHDDGAVFEMTLPGSGAPDSKMTHDETRIDHASSDHGDTDKSHSDHDAGLSNHAALETPGEHQTAWQGQSSWHERESTDARQGIQVGSGIGRSHPTASSSVKEVSA